MIESDKLLVTDLTFKRLSKEAFLKRYSVNPETDPAHIRELLAAAAEDRRNLTEALYVGYAFGFTRACVPVFCELIQQDWHEHHEDLADLLQDFRDPKSTSALLQAAIAKHDYLVESERADALKRRCIWALGDIDTDESRSTLRTLLSVADERAKGVVLEQLDLGANENRNILPYRQHRDRRYRHPLDRVS